MLFLLDCRSDVLDLEISVATILLKAVCILIVDHQIDLQIAKLGQLVAFLDEVLFALAFDRLSLADVDNQSLQFLLLPFLFAQLFHLSFNR